MALRNHPKISAATREKVHRIAADLGYRVDPRVARLMHHLREGHQPGYQSTIWAITTVIAGTESPYVRELIQGARQQAQALGYRLELTHLEDSAAKRRDLHRMLYHRGVEGVLLLPMKSPRVFTRLLQWEKFSVVAATYGVLAPQFHRVVPHQFANTQQIYQELARRGYRRIGLVVPELHDIRSNHSFTSAFAGMCFSGGMEVVQPLVHPGSLPSQVKRWYDQQHPDVVVAAGEVDCRTVASALTGLSSAKVDFAVLARPDSSRYAGIYEQPLEIGKTAIDALHSQIQSGEKGIPLVPRVTMIGGRWIEGPSLRRKSMGASTVRPQK